MWICLFFTEEIFTERLRAFFQTKYVIITVFSYVCLLLTLNIFHNFFWYLYYWLWPGEFCWVGTYKNIEQKSLNWSWFCAVTRMKIKVKKIIEIGLTAWKVSKYGVFSGTYFPYSVRIQENTDQKKLYIWTLFTQWLDKLSVCISAIQARGDPCEFHILYLQNGWKFVN